MTTELKHIKLYIPCEYVENQITAYRIKSIADMLIDKLPWELEILREWLVDQIRIFLGKDEYQPPTDIDEIKVKKILDIFDQLNLKPLGCVYTEETEDDADE